MKLTKLLGFFLIVILNPFISNAQEKDKIIYMDLAHGQRMWNDHKDMVPNIGFQDSTRIAYMNDELAKSLEHFNAKVSFLKKEIDYKDLKKGSLLILHVPSIEYTKNEVEGIKRYLNGGGSLLVIMEADYWTDLERSNVNDIILEQGVRYGSQSKDTLAGGYTRKGAIIPEKLKVTYELGRSIEGGVPFAYNSQTNKPFAVYKQLDNGGRLIVLGDAMASLYMTEWRGITDYQCQEFMQGIFKWLLEK